MKKLTAMLLSTAIVMNFAAVGCAADSEEWKNNVGTINLNDLTVSGNGISVSDNTVSITSGGDFEVTGTLADGMIYVNTEEKVKLRLSGASITNNDGPAIFFDNAEKGFITITENTENHLSDGGEYTEQEADAVIFSNDDLEIKGDGKLTIDANYKHGIAGDDDVSIENGVITIDSYEHGIKVNDTLSIRGGKITVNSETGKGMKSDLEVIIDDGDIDITTKQDEGIESKGTLTINGGDINVISGEDGINTGNASTTDATAEQGNVQRPQRGQGENMTPPEGMPEMPKGEIPADGQMPQRGGGRGGRGQMNGGQPPEGMENGGQPPQKPDGEAMGKMPEMSEGGMPQRGGEKGMGGGFGHVDEETAKAHAITINGGTIYVNAKGDGIDSNGNLNINGGTIIIDGPENSGNGPIDSDGTMTIKGGVLISASSAGMLQLPQGEGNQNILRIIFTEKQSAGTKISVTESESGTEIAAHTPQRDFQAFILSADELESGKEYTIYVNGEKYESVTVSEGISSVGTAQGGFGGGMGGGRGQRPNGNQNGTAPNTSKNNSEIKVKVDGKNINFDTQPVIKNDTTLVGFRAILEALGAEVTWDSNTKTVTATKDDTEIVLTIGKTTAYVNGEAVSLLTAPEIINDSTLVPVRFISERVGMQVDWNGTEKLITVTSPKK